MNIHNTNFTRIFHLQMRASEQLRNNNGEVRADQHSKVNYRTGRLETVVPFVKILIKSFTMLQAFKLVLSQR